MQHGHNFQMLVAWPEMEGNIHKNWLYLFKVTYAILQ